MPELELYDVHDVHPLVPLPPLHVLTIALGVRVYCNFGSSMDWWINCLSLAVIAASEGRKAMWVRGFTYESSMIYSRHDRTVVALSTHVWPQYPTVYSDGFDIGARYYFHQERSLQGFHPEGVDA